MRTGKIIIVAAAVAAVVSVVLASCSSQKNTAKSRRFHSFHTRYNIYYNGSQAYIDASLEREQGHVDNFTEMIPLYTVANKTSRELGKANFDRAIEKSQKAIARHSIKKRPEWTKRRRKTKRDIEWLNRKEYNPFLWKAWMLLGRSQFQEGSFDEAASTFSYMSRLYSTQPAIYGKARAWLAKSYIEQDWIYDAEDVITKMNRDSIHWRAQKEWDYTFADYYIHTKRYEQAIPYLRKVIKHEMRRKQKAREWYLMGQLYAAIGQKEQAYKAYRRVTRLNPPYQLDFNAKIAMTEVMAGGKPKQMIRKLKRMALSDKNKEYLDQVYYAIGNIYIAEKDTSAAISAYEKGSAKATRTGIEKGVLLLTLGDLYWQLERFSDARRCYGEAIGLLDKERDDYDELSKRSTILDELVPYTETIHLQDSLQELANMSEEERNKAIDRVIEALKKKEKEEKRAQQEAEAQSQLQQTQQQGTTNATQTSTTQTGSTFYFYNPTAVTQGKETFRRLWGQRENADDWQRANKTVVAMDTEEEEEDLELTDEQRDSLLAATALQDSIEAAADSAVNDPHKREYYLAQIPFTEEQKAESDKKIMDGLFHSGVIFKDKLYNLKLSEKQLLRLLTQYAGYEREDEALYHLFLLYSQKGLHDEAAKQLQLMKDSFPESKWTILLDDPYFEENARFGKHMEDSLYAETYNAFKAGNYKTVKQNTALSDSRFPLGDNRDKFIFIDGLTKLNEGDSEGCLEAMKKVVEQYPTSDVSPIAGMIVNGTKEGRSLQGGSFDIGNVWERRSAVLADSDSIAALVFVAERETKFVCLIAFEPDSLNENQLLFEVARFNFSNFVMRNFDMAFDDDNGLRRMIISGFKSYDEAMQYTREMYRHFYLSDFGEQIGKARVIIISEANMELLGRQFSYNDYDLFYEQHFIPLKVSTVRLLTEPETIEYQPESSTGRDSYGDNEPDEEGLYGGDDLYNGGVIDDEMLYELEIEPEQTDDSMLILPDDDAAGMPADEGVTPADEGGINIPADEGVAPTDEGVAPTDENSAPTGEGVAPADESLVPTGEGAAPTDEDIVPAEEGVMPADEGGINIPAEEGVAPVEENEETTYIETEETDGTITIPDNEEKPAPQAEAQPQTDETIATEEESTTVDDTPEEERPANVAAENKPQPDIEQPTATDDEDTGIYFDDGFGATTPVTTPANNRKQQEFNIEDEYYDLDGF